MAIVGQLTATWGDNTSDEVLSGRTGTHQYTENGLYQIKVQDEDGNYGLAFINVALKPVVLKQDPEAGLSANAIGDYVTLLLHGQHFSAGMQFVVNPGNLIAESEWSGVTWISDSVCEITFRKDKLLAVPVGQTLVIKLRYPDPSNPNTSGWKTYLSGPDVTVKRLDQPATGAGTGDAPFSDQFSDEFTTSTTPITQADIDQALAGTVEQALAWASGDSVKASMMMATEVAGKNRTTLIAALQDIANSATHAKG